MTGSIFSAANFDSAFSTFLGSSSSAFTLYSGPIFDFTVSPSATIGTTFSGSVFVTANDFTTGLRLDTGDVPYTGMVVGAAVPEPSAFFLLATGLLTMLGAARLRLAL